MGIQLLKQSGVEVIVLSKEKNQVVSTRCQKLGLPVVQGIDDKPAVLRQYLSQHSISAEQVVYLGNDINDTPCFPMVAYAAVVADANKKARQAADRILQHKGGHGAVREMCEIIIEHNQKNLTN